MEIPYTVQPRPDTGVYNAKVGMWLFLASEIMLFGGLFSAYILLRMAAPVGTWPHGWLHVELGTINTVLLALSAVTTLMAWAACKSKMFERFKFYMGVTLVLGVVFLSIKGYEYRDKLTHYRVTLKDGQIADGHLVERKASGEMVLHGRTVKDAAELSVPFHGKAEEIVVQKDQIARTQIYGPALNTYLATYFTLTGLHGLHVIGGLIVFAYLWGPGSRMWKTDPDRLPTG